jgi:hypothetical protein
MRKQEENEMEVRIGNRAHAVLDRHHAFKARLIEELQTEGFANICFIEEPSTEGVLEIKCLGGREVVVPEAAFNNPATPRAIINDLAMAMK